MRGEDLFRPGEHGVLAGSPPHARGRRCRLLLERPLKRITPACAGKTPWVCIPWSWETDHPRMRGEDVTTTPANSSKVGSPPHARGRPGAVAGDFPVGGITPACAGKTRDHWLCAYKGPDHPRMRGEDLRLRIRSLVIRGSPPHARGRRVERSVCCIRPGITPACAGKTRCEG